MCHEVDWYLGYEVSIGLWVVSKEHISGIAKGLTRYTAVHGGVGRAESSGSYCAAMPQQYWKKANLCRDHGGSKTSCMTAK